MPPVNPFHHLQMTPSTNLLAITHHALRIAVGILQCGTSHHHTTRAQQIYSRTIHLRRLIPIHRTGGYVVRWCQGCNLGPWVALGVRVG